MNSEAELSSTSVNIIRSVAPDYILNLFKELSYSSLRVKSGFHTNLPNKDSEELLTKLSNTKIEVVSV
jgi:predicted transcriptional regulator